MEKEKDKIERVRRKNSEWNKKETKIFISCIYVSIFFFNDKAQLLIGDRWELQTQSLRLH